MVMMRSMDLGPRYERLQTRAIAALPYGLLLVSLGITVGVNGLTGATTVTVLWSLGAAVWMLAGYTLRPESSRPDAVSIVYFVGLLAFNAVLIMRVPWFGAFAFSAYVHAFDTLPGLWVFGGTAANAVLMAIAQVGGPPGKTGLSPVFYMVLIIVNVALASGFSYYGKTNHEQNMTRKKIIAELEETNLRLAAALAENAGLHEQLLTQAREAGMLDERQRMAREIHDTIAQGLTGIITQLEAASSSAVDWQRHHANAMMLARESLTEARRSVRAVRPEPLAQARLPEAMASVVQRWSHINAVPVELTTTGTVRPMHPEVEVTLLRTAQEALANVAKHARANRVGLTLSYMEDLITLDVRDDGVGFEPGTVTPDSFGLMSMRQRVDRLAGSLEVESAPGTGTAISASLPAVAVGASAGVP
jgi:signal transduction histidine kinase